MSEPIRATDLAPPTTDPTNEYDAPIPPRCEGCGGPDHGGVNATINCLRASLRSVRELLKGAVKQLAPYKVGKP